MNTTIVIVVVGVAVIYLLTRQSGPGILQQAGSALQQGGSALEQGGSDLAQGFGFMSGSG